MCAGHTVVQFIKYTHEAEDENFVAGRASRTRVVLVFCGGENLRIAVAEV